MKWLQNLPIKRKLTLVILLTCSVALLLACGVLAGYEVFEFRRAMVRDMTVLADVLAKNTRAALAFQDEKAASDTLLALQAEPSVSGACLYTSHGDHFADYARPEALIFPTLPSTNGYRFDQGHLILFRPVFLNEKRIGTICLQASLEGMYERLRLFGGVAFLALLGSVAVGFLLSSQLQRLISRPILALAETARVISEHKDYTVRAPAVGENEVGVLTTAFNQMLGGIGERENALRTANNSLREEVVERKQAEGRAQAQLARLQLLNEITRAIGERQDLQSIFQVVIRNLEEHLPIDFCSIFLYDQVGTLTVASVSKRDQPIATKLGLAEQTKIPVGQNGLSRCVRGHLVYESNTSEIQFPFPQQFARGGLHSLVAAPLLVESQIFGVLLTARHQPNAFSSGECEFLKQLSEHIALAAHQAQLYGALQQAYDDLRQTQQAILQQERLRALGQMASGIAHDINNAISPVALYTESLLENEPGLSSRTRSYLETIQHAIEDVAATVARMREFYRQREPQLTLQPVHLDRLIKQVLELSQARWSDMPQQRGIMIKVATEVSENLPPVMGIESEIREALVNLIFNAVDAMAEGGTLTLRVKLAETGSQPSANAAVPRRVHVDVADTGIGMDDDTRRRCLEPFFTTKGERGTGLGLAMVYGMIQRHGADIEIQSSPGKGTTFRLIFPVSEKAPDEPLQSPAGFVLPPRLRILVVDDDPLLIKSLRDILETDGHVVVTANGGQAGIDTFRSSLKDDERFGVVITDLGMPNVDGRKVASTIKGASPETPVILLTGWGQRLMVEGDIPPHVDHTLSKPPKLREIREALRKCLLLKTG